MKILCIVHADFETPGVIESWAKAKQYEFAIGRPYLDEPCADLNQFDCLIIMGGPQSASEYRDIPYLFEEVLLIQRAIAAKKLVLGVCLGAQLIGEALGATTERSPYPERGVFPINLEPAAQTDPLLKDLPLTFPVFHWHNDMPGLPTHARILASSEGCPRQIIHFGDLIYGFQCHLEMTLHEIALMEKHESHTNLSGPFSQSFTLLRQYDYQTMNDILFVILDRLAILFAV